MEFKDILISRRAINNFDPEQDVDNATLHSIIETAGNAPSSFNLQPWKIVVVRDQERKDALRKIAFDQPKVSEAPVILMILGDRAGWMEGCTNFETQFTKAMQPEQRDWFVGATKGLYGSSPEASQAFANKNAGLFAMSLMYAATEHGLHTHPMDGFDHNAVREEFQIPMNYWISMLIAVGHMKPGNEIHPKGWRQAADEIIIREW